METTNERSNKNGKVVQKNDEDFMDEEKIQTNLKGGINKNKDKLRATLNGRTILVGTKEIDIDKLKGDPLPWIRPDHDLTPQEHKHKHEFTYPHSERLGEKRTYDCDMLTDEWYKWHLRTPASISAFTNPSQSYEDTSLLGGRNAFLFQDKDNGISVYFAAASPFQEPDIRTITMTEQVPLLVPVYNMSASTEDQPSKGTPQGLTELIVEDLSGILELRAWFDRNPIEGCCVIRQSPLEVTNVPTENVIGIPEDRLLKSAHSIKTCHGGYWLLIKEDKLTPGDHLLEYLAISKNYELNVKMLINVLV